jgi:hypothetical protein
LQATGIESNFVARRRRAMPLRRVRLIAIHLAYHDQSAIKNMFDRSNKLRARTEAMAIENIHTRGNAHAKHRHGLPIIRSK